MKKEEGTVTISINRFQEMLKIETEMLNFYKNESTLYIYKDPYASTIVYTNNDAVRTMAKELDSANKLIASLEYKIDELNNESKKQKKSFFYELFH